MKVERLPMQSTGTTSSIIIKILVFALLTNIFMFNSIKNFKQVNFNNEIYRVRTGPEIPEIPIFGSSLKNPGKVLVFSKTSEHSLKSPGN